MKDVSIPMPDDNLKYIRVYGTPPPFSDTRQPNTQLIPSPEPNTIVDIIDATNEEPFTLETLEELIKSHHQADLDFILARVQTMDTTDNNRSYFSYYAANHINKIIFRTQTNEGLLHRMRAKNPMNNMTIVGDVHYYVIRKPPLKSMPRRLDSGERASNIKENLNQSKNTNLSDQLFCRKSSIKFIIKPTAFECNDQHNEHRSRSLEISRPDLQAFFNETNMKRSQSSVGLSQKTQLRSVAYSNDSFGLSMEDWLKKLNSTETPSPESSPRKRKLGSQPASPSKTAVSTISSPTKSPTTGKSALFYDAHYLACDDDFLIHQSIRKYFRNNAVADDAVLFELHLSGSYETAQHPALENVLLMVNEGSVLSRFIKRNLKWMLTGYAIFSVILVAFAEFGMHFRLMDPTMY